MTQAHALHPTPANIKCPKIPMNLLLGFDDIIWYPDSNNNRQLCDKSRYHINSYYISILHNRLSCPL